MESGYLKTDYYKLLLELFKLVDAVFLPPSSLKSLFLFEEEKSIYFLLFEIELFYLVDTVRELKCLNFTFIKSGSLMIFFKKI